MAKILVTGATGFVGKRLIFDLLKKGHDVYALCRIKGTYTFAESKPHLHYLWGDLSDPGFYAKLPEDIDAAYYLVHSMTKIVSDLVKAELDVAHRFMGWIQTTKIRQIIYLGGIINDEHTLSPHLRSRLLVENVLTSSKIPITILRASIIIGSGSASFEIIRDLTEKLPVMIAPKWVNTLCQPISIRDVIFYLSSVLLRQDCFGKIFDIGGPEVFTFKQLMLEYAKFRHLKRWIIEVPVLTPRLSSYWLVFISSVRFSLCRYLVESMKNNSICLRNEIGQIIPHETLKYIDALEIAFEKIASHQVISTWMDSWESEDLNPDIDKYAQTPKEGCLYNRQVIELKDNSEKVIERIWKIGGDTGWYALDWAWRLRGLIDQLLGGVGMNRGRRDPAEIQVGDSIDFWRVLHADKTKGHLILLAGMRVPGDAWLEFEINRSGPKPVLIQTATFRPKGVLGRLYWYALSPFHFFIFKKMARTIAGH